MLVHLGHGGVVLGPGRGHLAGQIVGDVLQVFAGLSDAGVCRLGGLVVGAAAEQVP